MALENLFNGKNIQELLFSPEIKVTEILDKSDKELFITILKENRQEINFLYPLSIFAMIYPEHKTNIGVTSSLRDITAPQIKQSRMENWQDKDNHYTVLLRQITGFKSLFPNDIGLINPTFEKSWTEIGNVLYGERGSRIRSEVMLAEHVNQLVDACIAYPEKRNELILDEPMYNHLINGMKKSYDKKNSWNADATQVLGSLRILYPEKPLPEITSADFNEMRSQLKHDMTEISKGTVWSLHPFWQLRALYFLSAEQVIVEDSGVTLIKKQSILTSRNELPEKKVF